MKILFIVFTCNLLVQDEIPEWFLNPPQNDKILTGIGVGESKYEAMTHALVAFCDSRNTKVDLLVKNFFGNI